MRRLSDEAADAVPAIRVLPAMDAIQGGVQAAKARFDDPAFTSVRRFDTNGHALVDLIQFEPTTGSTVDRSLYASIDLLQGPVAEIKPAVEAGSGVGAAGSVAALTPEQQAFKQWLMTERFTTVAFNPDILGAAVDKFMNFSHRSSVINLQQEVEMHMRLTMRCVQPKYGADRFTDQHLQKAFEHAAVKMNQLVREHFCSALMASMDGGDIDLITLNTELDKARKKLLPETKSAMAEALLLMCTDRLDVEPLDWRGVEAAINALESKDLTHTTATNADYVFTDNVAKSCVWVEGSMHTAHNKVVGDDIQARRQFKRFAYDPADDTLALSSSTRIEARVPSLSPSHVDKPEAIVDVAKKLASDQRALSATGNRSPMIYGLLTSLNGFLHDKTLDHKNRQRQSAKRILMAAHRFNRKQLSSETAEEGLPFCLVANIPVNQHTDTLTLGRSSVSSVLDNDVLLEASLMAEVAVLATLNQRVNLLGAHQRFEVSHFNTIAQTQYENFLNHPDAELLDGDEPSPVYFYKSEAGIALSADLKARNAGEVPPIETKKNETIESLVTKAMFRMHATGDYRKPKYGLVVQSMLVFLQDKSLYGCKSANERFKAVEGRVDMFHLLAMAETRRDGLSPEHSELRDALRLYFLGEGDMDQLQTAVDNALDAHCLYAAGMFVSSVDQGGAPKTLSFDSKSRAPSLFKSPAKKFNTNFAETSCCWKQTKASKWQAHKGDHAGALQAAWFTAKESLVAFGVSLDASNVDDVGVERVVP